MYIPHHVLSYELPLRQICATTTLIISCKKCGENKAGSDLVADRNLLSLVMMIIRRHELREYIKTAFILLIQRLRGNLICPFTTFYSLFLPVKFAVVNRHLFSNALLHSFSNSEHFLYSLSQQSNFHISLVYFILTLSLIASGVAHLNFYDPV